MDNEEFEACWGRIQDIQIQMALEVAGLSDARIRILLAGTSFFMLIMFLFIFVGMAALAGSGGAFGSVVNSAMVGSSGAGAVSGDNDPGEEEAAEEMKAQLTA